MNEKPGEEAEDGRAQYHYDRGERLALPTALGRSGGARRGFFRTHRTLLIIFLDLIIILVLGLVLMRFLYTQTYRASLGGYSVVLRGSRAGEVVLASLITRNREEAEGGAERVYARFGLQKDLSGGQAVAAAGTLPVKPGEETVLRVAIPLEPGDRMLYAEVRIGETVRRLSRSLER